MNDASLCWNGLRSEVREPITGCNTCSGNDSACQTFQYDQGEVNNLYAAEALSYMYHFIPVCRASLTRHSS